MRLSLESMENLELRKYNLNPTLYLAHLRFPNLG
jgi:hypothetical protein